MFSRFASTAFVIGTLCAALFMPVGAFARGGGGGHAGGGHGGFSGGGHSYTAPAVRGGGGFSGGAAARGYSGGTGFRGYYGGRGYYGPGYRGYYGGGLSFGLGLGYYGGYPYYPYGAYPYYYGGGYPDPGYYQAPPQPSPCGYDQYGNPDYGCYNQSAPPANYNSYPQQFRSRTTTGIRSNTLHRSSTRSRITGSNVGFAG